MTRHHPTLNGFVASALLGAVLGALIAIGPYVWGAIDMIAWRP